MVSTKYLIHIITSSPMRRVFICDLLYAIGMTVVLAKFGTGGGACGVFDGDTLTTRS